MTEKPKRIQRKRSKGWRMPKNTVYVGRGTVFGNPFTVSQAVDVFDCGKETAHVECVNWFREWLSAADDAFGECREYAEMKPQRDRLLSRISELHGKNLACFCGLDFACHADVLLEMANSPPPPAREGE